MMDRKIFDENMEFSVSHDSEINEILYSCLRKIVTIRKSNLEEDFRGVDVCLEISSGNIGKRVVRPSNWEKFHSCIFRKTTSNGNPSADLTNIENGTVRWYVYGWLDGSGAVAHWILIDVTKLSEIVRSGRLLPLRDGSLWYELSVRCLASTGCIVQCSDSVMQYVFEA